MYLSKDSIKIEGASFFSFFIKRDIAPQEEKNNFFILFLKAFRFFSPDFKYILQLQWKIFSQREKYF